METPWKVVGFEKFTSEKGDTCIRLFVARAYMPRVEGNVGEGLEVQRMFYKPEYVRYEPKVGHMIIVTEGRFGAGSIGQIFVIGDTSKSA